MEGRWQLSLVSGLMLGAAVVGTDGAIAQQLRPHANAILHSFPGEQVYPESVTVDTETGDFYVGSVKEGTIFRGKVGSGKFEVFSAASADGRSMATGMFYAKGRLVVVGRQTGQIFVYDTKTRRLIDKFHNGLEGVDKTFLNDTTFAADGSAYVTDSVNPVLYRVAPVATVAISSKSSSATTIRRSSGSMRRAHRESISTASWQAQTADI